MQEIDYLSVIYWNLVKFNLKNYYLIIPALLSSFIKLIACPNDLLRSQGAMLKYLHIISSDLMQVYDPIRLR